MVFSQSGFHQLWSFWPRFYIVVLGIVCLFFITFIYIWTFISLFFLDFYFPFFFELLFLFSLLSLDFFIQSQSVLVIMGSFKNAWQKNDIGKLCCHYLGLSQRLQSHSLQLHWHMCFFVLFFGRSTNSIMYFVAFFFWIEPEIAEAIKFRRGHWCQIKPWF